MNDPVFFDDFDEFVDLVLHDTEVDPIKKQYQCSFTDYNKSNSNAKKFNKAVLEYFKEVEDLIDDYTENKGSVYCLRFGYRRYRLALEELKINLKYTKLFFRVIQNYNRYLDDKAYYLSCFHILLSSYYIRINKNLNTFDVKHIPIDDKIKLLECILCYV